MNLNQDILEQSDSYEDVNILVGINGSGKSTYLNELSKHFLERGKKVVAIANTVYDKFDVKHNNIKILRQSKGKSVIKNTIIDVFQTFHSGRDKDVYGLTNVFRYVGFDSRISLKIVGLNKNYKENLVKSRHMFEDREIHDLLVFFNEYIRIQDFYKESFAFTISHGWKDVRSLEFMNVLKFERKLRRAKVLSRIDLYFNKGKLEVPINQASSGELAILSAMMFINTHIDRDTVILIDEPENSLHPKWQKDYIQRILDLFHYYQPKIIVATHSPLIINGAESTLPKLNVFKASSSGDFTSVGRQLLNIEEIYDDYFDLVTPQNRFLSNFVIEKLNLLYAGGMKVDDFITLIKEQIENSFDDKQKRALSEIIKLAKEV